MAVQVKPITVEEFWEKYAGKPYELVRGEVVEIVATGYKHGSLEVRVSRALLNFVEKNGLGDIVGGETGFRLAPETFRAADVAFISNEKLKSVTEPQKYLPFAPDLAVEIVSPGDTPSDIQDKLDMYLEAGTRLVWIFYPDLKKVVTHGADGRTRSLGVGHILEGGDVLPGLSIPVADMFPPEQE